MVGFLAATGLSTSLEAATLAASFLVSRSRAATLLVLPLLALPPRILSRSSLASAALLVLKSTTELVLEPILDRDWDRRRVSTMISSYRSLPTLGSLVAGCRPRAPGGCGVALEEPLEGTEGGGGSISSRGGGGSCSWSS